MKTTRHYKGHRWTNDELRKLMRMWQDDATNEEMMTELKSNQYAIRKMIYKLREQGVPLKRRDRGRKFGTADAQSAIMPGKNYGRLWTQSDMEYVVRRRKESASAEEIAVELGRSVGGIHGVIQKLRSQFVPVPMRGQGVRRLWDPTELRAKFIEDDEVTTFDEFPQRLKTGTR